MTRQEFWTERYNTLYRFVLDRAGKRDADKLATQYANVATSREVDRQHDKGNMEW